jgi:hypothetical protein
MLAGLWALCGSLCAIGRWRLHPSSQGRASAQSHCRGLSTAGALHSAYDDPWMIVGNSVNANGCYGRLGCPLRTRSKGQGLSSAGAMAHAPGAS